MFAILSRAPCSPHFTQETTIPLYCRVGCVASTEGDSRSTSTFMWHAYHLTLHMCFGVCLSTSSMVKGYAALGQLDEAERVLERMDSANVEPGLGAWKFLVHAARAAGDMLRVDRLYKAALASRVVDSNDPVLGAPHMA